MPDESLHMVSRPLWADYKEGVLFPKTKRSPGMMHTIRVNTDQVRILDHGSPQLRYPTTSPDSQDRVDYVEVAS